MKHSYQTRRLLALRDIRHDGQEVATGGEVFATETDAKYLISAGIVRDPDEIARAGDRSEVIQIQKAVAATVSARRGPGRPPKAAPAAGTMTAADNAHTGAPRGGEQDPGAGASEFGGAEESDADGAGESGDQTAG